MYSRYFGLKEEPFSIAPNPRYLFMSEQHREALGHLLYGVGVGGGFVLLTGEVGTGKTTICRSLLEQLPDTTDIAFILNPYQDAVEILATVCDELEIEYKDQNSSLRGLSMALYKFLLRNHARGRNTVLLIDEAQNLEPKVLELIRLLTNLETDSKKLLQIIFIGQPELKHKLAQPELRQLAQRITARFHMEPLSLEETRAYIRHRLHIAGLPVSQELFSAGIVKNVFNRSGGVPRLINVLCDRMLLGTYAQNKTAVDKATFNKAAKEVLGKKFSGRRALGNKFLGKVLPAETKPLWSVAAAVTGVALVFILGFLLFDQGEFDAASTLPIAALSDKSSAAQVHDAELQLSASSSVQTLNLRTYASESAALSQLFGSLGLPQLSGPSPCEATTGSGWQCRRMAVKNWQSFIDVNRPAVLRLVASDGTESYGVVSGLKGVSAQLLFEGQASSHALMTLGQTWTGEFAFIWQGPDGFNKPIAKGERSALVTWVADRFALLDGQNSGLSEGVYNDALARRVTLFQQQQGLDDDGIVGLNTLLKLNEALNRAHTLSAPLRIIAAEEG